jgi:tight adherence protein C
MTLTFVPALLMGLALLAGGFVVLVASARWLNRDDVGSRLKLFVLEQETTSKQLASASPLRTRELAGSLTSRMLMPWLRSVSRFINRLTPKGVIDDVAKQLLIAGHPYGFGAREFIGLHFAISGLGLVAAYFMTRRGSDFFNTLLSILVFLLFFLMPILWLRMKVSKRQTSIQNELPDALDMLSVCATAGLGFDQSLLRVSQHWETDLSTELSRVINEIEMGFSRQEALRNLANRLDVDELTSFVSLILQSDQLGMSISDTLHAQSDQMRIERRYRALEKARKIPIKMLIPMTFLIFPAILAIILGPAIPDLLEFFANFGG